MHSITMIEGKRDMGTAPHIGDSISYRLRLSEKPVDPLRLWHGVVEWAAKDWYKVRLTDKGYEGIRELVIGFQIMEIEHEPS
jgi:hypothetical protein